MTIRVQFEKKKRTIMTIGLSGFFLGMFAAFLNHFDVFKCAANYALLFGLILFTLAMIYANLFAFICPKCGGNWGILAMQGKRFLTGIRYFLSMDSRIRYCPFCGIDIDRE